MRLELIAIAEVAGIAETGHNVFMLVHAGVYGGAPNGGTVGREGALHVLYALRRGNDAAHMNVARHTLGDERLIAQLHASARGEHRVGNDERFPFDAGRGEILHVYAHLVALIVYILAVGAHESIAGMVEDIEEAIVERQSGAEDGGKHYFVYGHVHLSYAQRRGNVLFFILQRARNLKGLELANTLDVITEKEAVFLILSIAYLRHILIDNSVLVAKINDVHKELSV